MRFPPPPSPDTEQPACDLTGRSVLLGIFAVIGGVAAFIGLSFVGSIFIAPWVGIVLPLGIVVLGICAALVVTATKENGW